MMRQAGSGVVLLAALLAATQAVAAALESASLTLVGPFIANPEFPGVGASGTAVSPSEATLAAGNAFAGTETGYAGTGAVPPGAIAKSRIRITKNAAGSFAGDPLAG